MLGPTIRSSALFSALAGHHDCILWFGYRIRNKHGQTAQDLVKPDDLPTLELFRQAQAQASIIKGDIACTSWPVIPSMPSLTLFQMKTKTMWHPMIQIDRRVSVKALQWIEVYTLLIM